MSIRLRLTLLYSAILALTLILFGVVLYTIQAQYTLNSLKRDLTQSSEKLVQAVLRLQFLPELSERRPRPPMPFDEFSNEQAFQSLPEREIARVLDANGGLVASPFGRNEDALPLSAGGLAAAQNQLAWWETAAVTDQRMLIYTRPVVVDGRLIAIIQTARPLTERDRTLQTLGLTLVVAGLLTTLAAFGIGWMLSGLSLRPIHRITQTARAIGNERDFTRRVEYRGPADEVGQLATTFNAMLSRLEDAYQKVAQSLQMQRSFVADVSHELRTPLTTLRGNLGLLRRTPPPPLDEQTDILSDMLEESDRLIRLVNDLLVLARADAGRSLVKEGVELQPVLEEACRQANQLDIHRQITMEIKNHLIFLGDRDAIKQVTLIVLDNAIKYSRGAIHITAEQMNDRVTITVADGGPGIAPETLEYIFDRFYRGEVGPAVPGFGLGLPIARALVESQGGAITIQSERATGSVVKISLPATLLA